MPESSAIEVLPISETVIDIPPNLPAQIMREWPDAAARAAIVAVACTLFWLTWAHWGSIQIDSGKELYIPAQILRGKLLYRDLWYPYAPLEPYVAAGLFALFGQHLNVLYLFGLALAIGCSLLIFEIAITFQERAAGMAAALLLLFSGFGPTICNYIFPYSCATPLGLLLSLLCALFTFKHALGRGRHALLLAGLAAGAAALCRQDMGMVCYTLFGFVLLMESGLQRSLRPLANGIVACTPGVAIAALTYSWIFWKLTPSFMVLDNWINTPGTYFARIYAPHMYAAIGFLFAPVLLIQFAFIAAAVLFLWFEVAKLRAGRSHLWPLLAFTLVLGLARATLHRFWLAGKILAAAQAVSFPKGVFFVGCAYLVYTIYELRRSGGERCWLAEAAFGVFALTLGFRVMAFVMPYGFAIFYGPPLFLVYSIVLVRLISAAVPKLASEQRRSLINSLIVAEVAMCAVVLTPGASRRVEKLTTSWGAIYLEPPEASVARQILDFVTEQKQQSRRTALLPQLPIVYALTGTEAPSRWYELLPGEVSPVQEKDYITDLRRADPEYIILTNLDTKPFGVPYFGFGYDQTIYRWIEDNYNKIGQFGHFAHDSSPLLAALVYERRVLPISAASSRAGTGITP